MSEMSIKGLMDALMQDPLLRSLLYPQTGQKIGQAVTDIREATSPPQEWTRRAEEGYGPTPDFSVMIPGAGITKALSAPKAMQSVKPWMGSAESKVMQAAVPYLEDIGSYGGFGGTLYMRFNPTKGPLISKEFTNSLRELVSSLGYRAEVTPLRSDLVGGVKQIRLDVFDEAGRLVDEKPLLNKLQELFGFNQ